MKQVMDFLQDGWVLTAEKNAPGTYRWTVELKKGEEVKPVQRWVFSKLRPKLRKEGEGWVAK